MIVVINDKILRHFKNEMIYIYIYIYLCYKSILYLNYIIILYNEKHVSYIHMKPNLVVQPKKADRELRL